MKELIRIFIGYSELDQAEVDPLYRRLSLEGFKPWIDRYDILPGDDAAARVRSAIYNADFFLVCLSNNSIESESFEPKLDGQLKLHLQGGQAKAFLIPVRLEECRVPKKLAPFETINLFEEHGWSHLLEVIDTVIRRRKESEESWNRLSSDWDIPVVDPASLLAEEESEGLSSGPADPSSASDWENDLRALINGKREDTLSHLGGPEEYVEVALEEARHAEDAETAFNGALRQIVQTWQPSKLGHERNTLYLLELIRAYTPDGGFVKVVELVEWLRHCNAAPGGEATAVGNDELLETAFAVLETYYKRAPKSPDDSYKTYLDLLKEELRNPQRKRYALNRLIDLKVIEPESQDVTQLIKTFPLVLEDLITILLDPKRRADAENALTVVFRHCLNASASAVQEFEQAVISTDGKVEPSDKGTPSVNIFSRGENLTLYLTVEEATKYVTEIYWKRVDREALKKEEALTQTTTA
jgi:hypothetical protein